ncbi:MAG: beta-glucosidase [Chloroflexi bacterium]|nr:MAG: beta-glucosidase [Chloroflexota bacterium]
MTGIGRLRSLRGRVLLAAATVLLAVSGGAAGATGAALPPLPRASIDVARVNALVHAMTLDEEIAMLTGSPGAGVPDPTPNGATGFVPGVPRLGIPAIRFTDGPAGVRNPLTPTTALPAPVSMAASFSTELARRYGVVLGRDARAVGQDVLFGPMVNLVRVPQAGRNFETLGEDPLLQSDLVTAETRGVQSQGVIATIKHLAENNQETNRMNVDVEVDDRTLHEMELPAFQAAIDAGAGAVMCAYPLVNGLHACSNGALLTDILREQWGFTGWVLSDYGAARNVASGDVTSGQTTPGQAAAFQLQAGLDEEFASNNFATVRADVVNRLIPRSIVDGAVRHILSTMDRFGLLDGASPSGAPVVSRPRPPIDVDADAGVARTVAEAGAVLLKDEGGVLPLSGASLRSLAVIGPTSRQLLVGGGGSARVAGFTAREISPLAALRSEASGAGIDFAVGDDLDGVPVTRGALTPPGGAAGAGLLRTDVATGATTVDPQVDFTGSAALPAGSRTTWTGTLTVPTSGAYDLKVQGAGGAASLTVRAPDGTVVASGSTGGFAGGSLIPTIDGLTNSNSSAQLTAGVAYGVVITGNAGALTPLQIRFAWVTPEVRQANIDQAAAAARRARTAVVFAYDEGTEGRDRASLSLPGSQDALIEAVAAANPHTVVVLDTGDPVLMPWVDRVAAVLEMWYPGQEGGAATADVLLGRADPGGRLPVTFPASEADTQVAGSAERYPGVPLAGAPAGQTVEQYSEGILVGYRWYDHQGITPLFPFGAGLSYTRFSYSSLRARTEDGGLEVSFRVRNSGWRTGSEVPQVYVGAPSSAPVPMADRALGGFARVTLRPGETAEVTLHVDSRVLSYWSVDRQAWVIASGTSVVQVGASSRDLRLSTTVAVG